MQPKCFQANNWKDTIEGEYIIIRLQIYNIYYVRYNEFEWIEIKIYLRVVKANKINILKVIRWKEAYG